MEHFRVPHAVSAAVPGGCEGAVRAHFILQETQEVDAFEDFLGRKLKRRLVKYLAQWPHTLCRVARWPRKAPPDQAPTFLPFREPTP